MKLAAVVPFPVGFLPPRAPRPGVLLVKVTLMLRDGATSEIAHEQLPLYGADQHPTHPSDFVFGGGEVEVSVVGHARSSIPQKVIPFRFRVGQLERRRFAHATTPVTAMPLSKDHVRDAAAADAPAVELGPRAPVEGSGQAAAEWLHARLPAHALVELEGLVEGVPLLRTRLPSVRPCAFIAPDGGEAPIRLALRPENVVVDVDAKLVTITWRGPVPGVDVEPRVVVAVESENAPLRWADVERRLAQVAWSEPARTDDWLDLHTTEPREVDRSPIADPKTMPLREVPADALPFESARATGRDLVDRRLGEEATTDGTAPMGDPLPFRPSDAPPPPLVGEEVAREAADLAHDTAPMGFAPSPSVPSPLWEPPRVGGLESSGRPPTVRAPNPVAEAVYGVRTPPRIDAPAPAPESEPALEQEAATTPESESTPDDTPRTSDDVTLELCAALRAALDLQPEMKAEILADERLDAETWELAERRHTEAVATAIHKGQKAVVETFDEAYLARLERERGVIDVATFADLELAIERGSLDGLIVKLGIPKHAVIRIKRVWTRRTLTDPELRDEVRRMVREKRAL